MSLETRKMPLPMVSPITMAVADHRPRPRTRSARSGCAVRLGFDALTEADRAYYPAFRRSINFAGELARSRASCVLWSSTVLTRYHRGQVGHAKIHAD